MGDSGFTFASQSSGSQQGSAKVRAVEAKAEPADRAAFQTQVDRAVLHPVVDLEADGIVEDHNIPAAHICRTRRGRKGRKTPAIVQSVNWRYRGPPDSHVPFLRHAVRLCVTDPV